ncbi:MAG TPA: YceI family protein [Blastocatellia bacterium]|nr:YceI family protein [Blastocatellia bacterium]
MKRAPGPGTMSPRHVGSVVVHVALAALMLLPVRAFSQDYALDPSRSRLEIHVFREGLLKFLGHDHHIVAQNITGRIHLEEQALERSSVQLTVEAASLKVVDPGVDEKERQEVQTTMESARVLDVKKFPTIVFTSTSIMRVTPTGAGYDLTLVGTLHLHGVEKQIRVPVSVILEPDQIRARGSVDILQSEFGITPIRIGGGTIRVKDKIRITYDIVAPRESRDMAGRIH